MAEYQRRYQAKYNPPAGLKPRWSGLSEKELGHAEYMRQWRLKRKSNFMRTKHASQRMSGGRFQKRCGVNLGRAGLGECRKQPEHEQAFRLTVENSPTLQALQKLGI
jgi:hypothetical protein